MQCAAKVRTPDGEVRLCQLPASEQIGKITNGKSGKRRRWVCRHHARQAGLATARKRYLIRDKRAKA